MRVPPEEPQRWADGLNQANFAERAAGNTVRLLSPPEKLDGEAYLRVWAAIRADRPRRGMRWVSAAAATVLGVAAVASAARMEVIPAFWKGAGKPKNEAARFGAVSGGSEGVLNVEAGQAPVAKGAEANRADILQAVPSDPTSEAEAGTAGQKGGRVLGDEAPGRQGARRAHGRSYATDEQRRRLGWIGGQDVAELLTDGTRVTGAGPSERFSNRALARQSGPRGGKDTSHSATLILPAAEAGAPGVQASGGPWYRPMPLPEHRPSGQRPDATEPAVASGEPVRRGQERPGHALPSDRNATPDDSAGQVLALAVQALHVRHSPDACLQILERQMPRLAAEGLLYEAMLLRVGALLALKRNGEALQILDGSSLADDAVPRRLLVIRGTLRAAKDRCAEAAQDFDRVLEARGGPDKQALLGRAVCRRKLGDQKGARIDFQRYEDLFSRDPANPLPPSDTPNTQ